MVDLVDARTVKGMVSFPRSVLRKRKFQKCTCRYSSSTRVLPAHTNGSMLERSVQLNNGKPTSRFPFVSTWLALPYRSREVMGARGYHRPLGFVIPRPRNSEAVGKNLLMPSSPSLLSMPHGEEAIALRVPKLVGGDSGSQE